MKQTILERCGPPDEVVRCAEVPDVGAPAAGSRVGMGELEEIKTALVHAERGERSSKILVAPNGPVRA